MEPCEAAAEAYRACCAPGAPRLLTQVNRLAWAPLVCSEQLVAASCRQLLLSGGATEAAAVLAELYASGHPHHVSRVAVAALVDAVDGGAVEAVAAAEALLWRRGCVPLLRDVWLAALREGWADALAAVAWQALRQGGGDMVTFLLAAIVGQGTAGLAAALVRQLMDVSACSPLVVKVRLVGRGHLLIVDGVPAAALLARRCRQQS